VAGRLMAAPTTVGAVPMGPPVEDAPPPPPRVADGGVRVLAGVPFAGLPGLRPLELDLWLPPTDTACPAVVFLHGGGFRVGSRRSVGPMYAGISPSPFEVIARSGVAVAGVDYRLSGEATFPAQLHDVKAAVRWLRARAGELGIDPARIAAWGESAGGNLALQLGLTAGDAALEGTVGVAGDSRVTAVVAWYAPVDLTAVATDAGADPMDPDSREAQLLGASVAAVPELAAAASPISHVSSDAPPVLLLHGRADRLISCRQSERMHQALVDAGADAELHLYDDADHVWFGAPEAAADAVQRTLSFLHRQLDPHPDPK